MTGIAVKSDVASLMARYDRISVMTHRQGFNMRAITRCLVAAACFAAPLPLAAQAVDFPARPVRMIVPYPPGGGTDIVARILGQKLTESWAQQVLVDNRPG